MNFTSHAKCIISGEHAVLRGSAAIAFPVKNIRLKAKLKTEDTWKVDFQGQRPEEAKLLFWLAMDRGLELLNKTRQELRGHLVLDNNIPVGSGLGASASFCVLVAKIFIHYGWLKEGEAFSFAKNLENAFHGESSGLDVAVSLKNKGIYFHKDAGIKDLDSDWQPNLYLSYCGSRGLTADCVKKVKDLWESDPDKAAIIDKKMAESVEKIFHAFTTARDSRDLKEGFDMGMSCFQDWNLVNANLREHIEELKKQGALALKPTGSGDGGYILSLWSEGEKPSMDSAISLF